VVAGHEGDREVVLAGLAADDPMSRSAALGAAHRLEILDDELVMNALDDPSVFVRRRGLQLAPRLRPPPPSGGTDAEGTGFATERLALIDRVAEMLALPDLAEEAAFCLGELEGTTPAAVAALEHQATEHDDALCRESAVAALGSLGVGRDAVLAATTDIATVRRRAVIALAAFDGDEVDAALRRALDDRDWQVRQAAEDLLEP
jgi:HEAT repeat protein